MKHVLRWEESPNRSYKGSENGRHYEAFKITILLYDDETNTVEERETYKNEYE